MRSPSSRSSASDSHLQTIDALFRDAGLVRSLRGKSGVGARTQAFDRAAPEELSCPAPLPQIASNGVPWLSVPGWEKISWLWHGFSTRKGGTSRAYCGEDGAGELNLGFTAADSKQAVTRNRSLLAEAITGNPATPLLAVRQFHSNLVHRATAADAVQERPWKAGVPNDRSSSVGWKAGVLNDRSLSVGWKADGQFTSEPGLLLGIQVADCIPVLVADRKRRVVAAFHAGWRGTVKRIVETGVGRMRVEFGSRPEDLIAAIGPGIGACCYAVGEEVLSEFESQFLYARDLFREVYSTDAVRTKYPMLFLTQRAPGHSPIGPSLHLDLVEANRRQLLAAGLKPRSIQVVGGCTNCRPDIFFSHRASQGHAGRMMAVIGIKPSSK
jgi:YfiH family protein